MDGHQGLPALFAFQPLYFTSVFSLQVTSSPRPPPPTQICSSNRPGSAGQPWQIIHYSGFHPDQPQAPPSTSPCPSHHHLLLRMSTDFRSQRYVSLPPYTPTMLHGRRLNHSAGALRSQTVASNRENTRMKQISFRMAALDVRMASLEAVCRCGISKGSLGIHDDR